MKNTLGLIFLLATVGAQASILNGSNVIVNPGFDAGSPSTGGGVTSVPGWMGDAGVGIYGVTNWWEIPAGAWSSGEQFFQGGSQQTLTISQMVMVPTMDEAMVDSGTASFAVSGWFGGWLGHDDRAGLTVNFYDASNMLLSSTPTLGNFTSADRGSLSSMLFDSETGLLPTNTRAIEFVLTATRAAGNSNDGVADTLSFTAVPEPATLAALGLGALALIRKRRAR